jgi:prolyl 4-hydroxylase
MPCLTDQSTDQCPAAPALQVKPRQGDALLFWNVHPNGTIDKHSLHGGCPVFGDTQKWAMTKWIRNKCFGGGC